MQAAKTLLAYNADVMMTDKTGCSPLRHAVRQGDADMVNRLICKGIDSTLNWDIPLLCAVTYSFTTDISGKYDESAPFGERFMFDQSIPEVRPLLYLHFWQYITSARLTWFNSVWHVAL